MRSGASPPRPSLTRAHSRCPHHSALSPGARRPVRPVAHLVADVRTGRQPAADVLRLGEVLPEPAAGERRHRLDGPGRDPRAARQLQVQRLCEPSFSLIPETTPPYVVSPDSEIELLPCDNVTNVKLFGAVLPEIDVVAAIVSVSFPVIELVL